MELSFHPLTLEALDHAEAEALCLFLREDERPLTGLAGLADWRLSGRLSRMLRAGQLTGASGEALLTPPGSRLAFKKLFLFGLGKAQSEQELKARLTESLKRLAHAGVRDAALQLPPRLAPEVAVRALVEEPEAPARALVFTPEPAKLVAALSHEATPAQIERRVVKVAGPRAPPLPFAPASQPLPTAAPPSPQEAPAPSRPPPPPPQRYVPPPPKEQGQKKKRR